MVILSSPYLSVFPKNHLIGLLPPCFIWEAEMGLAIRKTGTRGMGAATSASRGEWASLQGSSLGMSPGKKAVAEQEMPGKWLMALLSLWRDVKRRYPGNDQWSNLLWMALHVKIIYSNSIWGWTFSPFSLFHESFKMDSNPTRKEN